VLPHIRQKRIPAGLSVLHRPQRSSAPVGAAGAALCGGMGTGAATAGAGAGGCGAGAGAGAGANGPDAGAAGAAAG
jgi:hypothetical protein